MFESVYDAVVKIGGHFVEFGFSVLVAEFVFCFKERTRRLFLLRLLAAYVPILLYYIFESDYQNTLFKIGWYNYGITLIFLWTLVIMNFVYKLSVQKTIIFSISGYIMQNIASTMSSTVRLIFGIERNTLLAIFLAMVVFAAVYCVGAYFFRNRIREKVECMAKTASG